MKEQFWNDRTTITVGGEAQRQLNQGAFHAGTGATGQMLAGNPGSADEVPRVSHSATRSGSAS